MRLLLLLIKILVGVDPITKLQNPIYLQLFVLRDKWKFIHLSLFWPRFVGAYKLQIPPPRQKCRTFA